MCDVINAKLNWDIKIETFNKYILQILSYVKEHNNIDVLELHCHELLEGLYDKTTLKELYLIRNAVRLLNDEKYKLFFNLAISQTLHRSAIHPIAVPYIVRSKKQVNSGNALDKFQSISKQMLDDLKKAMADNIELSAWVRDLLFGQLNALELRYTYRSGRGDAFYRYVSMLEKWPHNRITQIPLKFIAQYLQITPQMLSKIRLRLLKSGK